MSEVSPELGRIKTLLEAALAAAGSAAAAPAQPVAASAPVSAPLVVPAAPAVSGPPAASSAAAPASAAGSAGACHLAAPTEPCALSRGHAFDHSRCRYRCIPECTPLNLEGLG